VHNEHQRAAHDLLRLGDLDGALRIAENSVQNATNPWPFRIVLLEVRRLRGQRDEALRELEHLELVDPPVRGDIESCISIKRLRGYYAGLLGRFRAAHQLLKDAEAIAVDASLIEPLAEVHQCQAMIYFLEQNYAESDRVFRVGSRTLATNRGWYFFGSALWGIGKNLMIQTHYDQALPWLQQALAVIESAGAKTFAAVVWEEMAVCELGLGNDVASLDLLRRAEAVQLEARAPANYQVVLANIGNVYLYRHEIAREIKDPVSIYKWTYNTNLALIRMREAIDQAAQNDS